MATTKRRSGLSLVLIGLAAVAYFWITDPRYGLALRWSGDQNPIDLANQHFPGTVVGIVGSVVVLLIGVYLLTRRTV